MLTLKRQPTIDTRVILLPLLFLLGYVASLAAFSHFNPITLVVDPLTIISHPRRGANATTASNPVPIPPPFVMTVPADSTYGTVGGDLSKMIMMTPAEMPTSAAIPELNASMTSAPGLGGDGTHTIPEGSLSPIYTTSGMAPTNTATAASPTGSASTASSSLPCSASTSSATTSLTPTPSTPLSPVSSTPSSGTDSPSTLSSVSAPTVTSGTSSTSPTSVTSLNTSPSVSDTSVGVSTSDTTLSATL